MKQPGILVIVLLVASTCVGQTLQIDSAEVDVVRDQLLIYGDFGAAEGSVTIDSADLRIVRWMPYWIRVELPRSGQGSTGDITVSNGLRRVTSARLTTWSISISSRHIIGDGRNNWSVTGSGYSGYSCSFRGVLRSGHSLRMVASRSASFYESSQFSHNLSYGQNSEYRYEGHSNAASCGWGDSTDTSGMFAMLTLDKNGAGSIEIAIRGIYPWVQYSEEFKDGTFTKTRDTSWSGVGGAYRTFTSDTLWQVEPEHTVTSPCSGSTYRSECISDFAVAVSFPPAVRRTPYAAVDGYNESVALGSRTEVYDLLGSLVWHGNPDEPMPVMPRGHYFIRTVQFGTAQTTRILQR